LRIFADQKKEYDVRMLFLIIESFKQPGALDVYRRARDRGRLMPDGLEYVCSWVDLEFTRCFQVMKTDDVKLIYEWIEQWKDLVDFEVIPVRTSGEAMEIIAPKL
jgi:hypothetical protein